MGDKGIDLPLGFGMALAQNTNAMEHFAKLPYEQKKAIVNHTHNITSKSEMQAFVRDLNDSGFNMTSFS